MRVMRFNQPMTTNMQKGIREVQKCQETTKKICNISGELLFEPLVCYVCVCVCVCGVQSGPEVRGGFARGYPS
jgi:hypothetical protein